MSTARSLTLIDLALPRASALHNTLLLLGASLITGLAAQIAIHLPWSPIPITGQTFAVLLSGAALGVRRSFAAQVLYLLEGAAGLPVFAGGAAGVAVFAGPTGGYLLAFPFAAAATGFLAEHGWDRRFTSMLAAMLLGSGIILAFGLAELSHFIPSGSLLVAGFYPFIPGDLIKAVLAALSFPAAWRFANRRRGETVS